VPQVSPLLLGPNKGNCNLYWYYCDICLNGNCSPPSVKAVHCDALPTKNPKRPFGFGCGLSGVISAEKLRLNNKLAANIGLARPDVEHSRLYHALLDKISHQRSNTVFTQCGKHPDKQ
jgi:hypothetical protein